MDKDTFRSPFTNRLFTLKKSKKGAYEIVKVAPPSNASSADVSARELRNLELAANEVWDAYVKLYYGPEGVGSAFLRSRSASASITAFEGTFGVHKSSPGNGEWDSVHLVRVDEPNKNGQCSYKVESAVVMILSPYEGTSISSSLNKETARTLNIRPSNVAGSHWENIGKIIEDVEIDFRSRLERVDVPRSLEIMDSAYKTSRDSVSAAMITGIDESEEPMMATGMGVGSAMIDEIADKAKQKQAEGNAFLDKMKAQQKAKDEQMKAINEPSNDQYSDLKKSLKKAPASPAPTEAMKSLKKDNNSPGYADLRASLKNSALSPRLTPKSPIPPASPEFATGKAGLRKSKVPAKLPFTPSSPTPEFLDFRSKLKKSGAK